MQQLIQMLWQHLHNGLAFGEEPFLDQIDRDFDSRLTTTLSISRLQHEEFPFLNGEFNILHISVVLFQNFGIGLELIIDLGHDCLQFSNGFGRTNASNHIFSLRIDQEFAKQARFSMIGITGETYTRSRCIAHVTKDHGLYIDSGSQQVANVFHFSVLDRSRSHPSTKDSPNGQGQLIVNILRKFQIMLGVHSLEASYHLL
mmetsp:Transcript_36646/g.76282  ORF Transcript_36646/g.76282 Transcript_36646/m.76282 type:complete len:201 (-) Transcript_36646:886-1488(-)